MDPKRNTPNPSRDDLTWLFGHCESEMGVKSNFSAIIMASKYGSKRTRIEDGELVNGVVEDLHNEDTLIDAIDTRKALSKLAASGKNRRIMESYARIHVSHQRTLEHAFQARQLPPEVNQVFGEVAGVVPLTLTARSLARFDWPWLAKAVVRKDAHVPTLKREAERLFKDALEAYARAKSCTPEEPDKPKGKRAKAEEATP